MVLLIHGSKNHRSSVSTCKIEMALVHRLGIVLTIDNSQWTVLNSVKRLRKYACEGRKFHVTPVFSDNESTAG
jgi:hypothetical protein